MHIFNNVLENISSTITTSQFGKMLVASIILGLVISIFYKFQSTSSRDFVITLSLLPTIIAFIILLVNGSLGTSIAVAGTFSLIRFRVAAGSSKEMFAVLLAMTLGLAVGMGHIKLAVIFTIVISIIMLIYQKLDIWKIQENRRHILLTIPTDYNYSYLFEKVFGEDCIDIELLSVVYKKKKEKLVLEYDITFKKSVTETIIMTKLLETNPLDVVINKQFPKKKFL